MEGNKRIRYLASYLICISIILSFASFVFAQSPAIDNGLAWINTNQNTDGEWGSNPDFQLVDTSTVLDTFRNLDISDESYVKGITWLGNQSTSYTDYLSRKIKTLHDAGEDITLDLDV